MCTCTRAQPQNENRHFCSALRYGRAPIAAVLAAALALLLAATPASRGGPACQSAQAWPAWSGSIVPGLARLVRLDRAGFPGAGVQLRRLNRSRSASFLRQVSALTAPTHVVLVSRSHISLSEGVPILYIYI